jgi:hypothetical protein
MQKKLNSINLGKIYVRKEQKKGVTPINVTPARISFWEIQRPDVSGSLPVWP